MAFTDALDVNVGDATKASDFDTLADNPEWLRTKSDVEHNFDISTGTGYHKGLTLPASAVFTWDGGDVTLTHSANLLTIAGGT
ncbi:MAG: hypothetical protein KKB38_20620, partial [Gammaproteobacteria bacterium]|nr:hypothetical protein [Gammaproteobacteria bacterium]